MLSCLGCIYIHPGNLQSKFWHQSLILDTLMITLAYLKEQIFQQFFMFRNFWNRFSQKYISQLANFQTLYKSQFLIDRL